MSVIRRMNINTGQVATEADEAAGLAHYVQCDHLGNVIRDENRQVTSYGGPEVRGAGLNPQAVALLRYAPNDSTQSERRQGASLNYDAQAQTDHEAVRAEFERRFGPGSVGPTGGHL
ncbi:hypothetical protein [Paraburkholderia sp. J76]|uniref:hypothetical protein n=1 Tax=Paraburkholderia sp. J76 TaxID=2805439 RepID=UPI002ABD9DD5|nr:hypothetical protein [Paraburkholderia sp. J76]